MATWWLLRAVVAVAAFVGVAWVMHRVMQPAALGYVIDDDAPPPDISPAPAPPAPKPGTEAKA